MKRLFLFIAILALIVGIGENGYGWFEDINWGVWWQMVVRFFFIPNFRIYHTFSTSFYWLRYRHFL